MILGERIKRIRTFRGLTQRELGLKLGYEERNADVRVAQYESGYRVPKKDTLMEIARILNVNYINFIIEENEEGSVKDIYTCSDFCTKENAVDKNKKQLSFTIYKDENVNFKPSKAYTFLNYKSISAINELKQLNNTEFSKEQIITWIKDYEDIYNSMTWVNMFYKDHSPFYKYYHHIKKIYEFIKIEEEASFALEEFSSVNLNEEIKLLKWLVKFEHLQYNLILLHPNIVSEESINSGTINLHQDFKIYFKTEILKNCISLEELFDKYYYEKLNKYNTLSKEVQEKEIPFDDD